MAKVTITEQEIQNITSNLHCTREEAIQIIKDDYAIDNGERLDFELPKEEEKALLKAAHKGEYKGPASYTFTKRERKPNEAKRAIMALLFEACGQLDAEDLTLANIEKEITFSFEGSVFSVNLVQHRPPKN